MDSNKYDRQVRLWSASGQESLGSSHVVVIGASLATLEAAKGLVLAGIGSLSIVEEGGRASGEAQLFSTDAARLQQQLVELNSDALIRVVQHTSEVDLPVSLVIYSCSASSTAEPALAGASDAPVLIVGSHMLRGFVRVAFTEHVVLQPHPETGLADLRTSETSLSQWPELEDYCDGFALDELSDTEHAHVPYSVLLVKVYRAGMTLRELKDALARLARSSGEENVEEAVRHARVALRPEVPAGVRELVEYRTEHRRQDESPFWLLVGALGTFIAKHGILPVSGEVPDMISSTENFVALKRIYGSRSQRDARELASYLPAGSDVPPSYLHIFCQNVRHLKLIYRRDDSSPKRHELEQLCLERPGRDIYAVASFVGGVAAQEATKLLMHQYVPALGVLLYDAGKGELFASDKERYTVIDAEAP